MARAPHLDAGATVAGYRLHSLLGRGGMGTVYRAEQLSLKREVALKLVATDPGSGDSVLRGRFLRESEIAGSLDHPNVVSVFDAGEADGFLYIAMRYIPGMDLQGLIRRERRLSPHITLAVLEQVAAALDAAHARGLVHRDVKPSNILIADEHGSEATLRAFLCDFGISKAVVSAADQTTERPLGTVHYASPEQIRGKPVDARSDIYSLGCVLYECLTGSVPFERESDVAVLYAHLEAPIPSLGVEGLGLPPELDRVVASALAKSPTERPTSASELTDAARGTLAGGDLIRGVATQEQRSERRARAATPPRLRPRPPLVGRGTETGHLEDSLDRTIAGNGELVLLTGEAGIGKTALARALSERAQQLGLTVVWGVGLRDEAAPSYFHWVQVIRGLARRRGGRELFAKVGPAAGWLGDLASDLGFTLPVPERTGVDEDRFRIYDAILRLLECASGRSALVIVLDDLQFADQASLLVLSFLARAIGDIKVLIVGTYRDAAPAWRQDQRSPLAEVASLSPRIELAPLSAHDVRALCDARGEAFGRSGLVDQIHTVTGGNPLFVSELLTLLESRNLSKQGWSASTPLQLPTGLRDAIAHRLGPLTPASHDALTVASVIGARFRADVLSRAADISALELLELLDEALSFRLLRPLTGQGNEYAFSHGLVQTTLYEALPRRRRVALHRAVGEALELTYDIAAGEGIAEVAHHYLEAAMEGDPSRAIEYARQAARQAVDKFAYDQAVGLLSRAVALIDPTSDARIDVLQSLGEAQMRAGDTGGARRTLVLAAHTARARGDAQALGRAALACGIWGLSFGVDEELVGLAEDAVAELERIEAPGLLARIKGLLAVALYYAGQDERRKRLCQEALESARAEYEMRRTRDSQHALAYVLGRYLLAMWGPDSARRDFGLSDEALALVAALKDRELEVLIRNWRMSVLLELGDFAAVDQEIARVEQMAIELRQPRAMVFSPLHHALRAASAGQLADAERLNAESVEIGRRVRGSVGELAATAQLIGIRMLQGRLPELEAHVRVMANANPGMVALRCALATLLLQAGRQPEARAELESLMARGITGLLPSDNSHIVILALLGDVATELADVDRARAIYSWLEPYSSRWVVSPSAAVLWPVDRSLGALSVAMGHAERALEHLADAREQAERVGAMTSDAVIMCDMARAVRARGRPDDIEESARLAREARQRAQRLGVGVVVDAATLLEAGIGVAHPG